MTFVGISAIGSCMGIAEVKHRIDVAAGRKPADLVLAGGRVVSVFADEIIRTDVAIADGVIVGLGNYEAKRRIDVRGGFISSGLIDSHIHIESTLLAPAEFARTVVPHGTTSVVADPHEIANVLGERGIRWMIEASTGLPLDIYIVLPSCVPASKFESPGAKLTSGKLRKLACLPRVIGIGEVMNYEGVIARDDDLLRKIRLIPGMRVDGHAPMLTGKRLNAYISAGIHSDHESTRSYEAKEKLLKGLHIMIREGTTEKNLAELAKMVTPANSHRCFFCSDDRSAYDLVHMGHMDETLRLAVRAGIPPITALQMATNNAPYYFRLKRRKGAIAVGYIADIVVFDDLKNFRARMVFKDGKLVAKDGMLVAPCRPDHKMQAANTVDIGRFEISDLAIPLCRTREALIVELIPSQITTMERVAKIRPKDGLAMADTSRDILKVAVVERHKATGRSFAGFVSGFGLRAGALASTVCHDAHNIISVGTNDADMFAAIMHLKKIGGGFVAVKGGKVLASLPLPFAGLMSKSPAKEVAGEYVRMERAARSLGSKVADPFLAMSFLSLSVVPKLRVTDRGLLDVEGSKLVPLFL